MKKNKIEISSKEITAETTYQEIEGKINNKYFLISRWRSVDNNCGETDKGYDFIESDKLTEEEKEEVENYCDDKVNY